MKVAFFLLHYPVFSETFVSKEILNLQNLNTDGLIVCEKQIHNPPFHPHIQEIKFPVHEINQKIIGQHFFHLISSHFYWFFHNPSAYFQSIFLLFSFFNFHHLRVFIKVPFLAKKLEKERIRLIYVHEVDGPSLFGLICSKLCQIPCGIIIHTQYLFAQNKYLASKIKNANFIVFQSHYSLKKSQEITCLPSKVFSKCHVLSTPGIDTDFFHPTSVQIFPKQIRLITIGRLEEAKGYPLLLKAIKKLKNTFPDILLTIIGDGSQKTQLKNYILKNNLQRNIRLVGFKSHGPSLIKLLNQHQYFILPSIIDSQKIHDVHPNVVKEAMSCGLITITSNLGGIQEIIKNNQNGFLIDNPNPQNISKIITTIHQLSFDQKKRISKSARQTILKHHRQEKICFQLKKIFLKYSYER